MFRKLRLELRNRVNWLLIRVNGFGACFVCCRYRMLGARVPWIYVRVVGFDGADSVARVLSRNNYPGDAWVSTAVPITVDGPFRV